MSILTRVRRVFSSALHLLRMPSRRIDDNLDANLTRPGPTFVRNARHRSAQMDFPRPPPAPPSRAAFSPRSRFPAELVALRRAAAFDLFRGCAFAPPPQLLWPFVDGTDDVAAATERFFGRIGYPIARLSTKHANHVLVGILLAETRLARMPKGDRDAIQGKLLNGDRLLTGRLVKTILRGGQITEIGAAWPTGHVPALLAILLQAIARFPVDGGEYRSCMLWARALESILLRQEVLRNHLLRSWMVTRAATPVGLHLDATLAAIELAEDALLLDGIPDRSTWQRVLTTLDDANFELERLANLPGDWPDDAAAPASAWRDRLDNPDRDAAMAWSEFARMLEEDATWPDLVDRWRIVRWNHHPDAPNLAVHERVRRRHHIAIADDLFGFAAVSLTKVRHLHHDCP